MSLLSFIFQIILLGVSVLTVFLFTTVSEYNMTSSLKEYKPQVYYRGAFQEYTSYPWEMTDATLELSLVVPAYNEENRLSKMMASTIEYFEKKNISYEIIIINDGSRDKTFELIQRLIDVVYSGKEIIGITYDKNGGKGFAINKGMKFCRGKYVLMLDADGATEISEYENLLKSLNEIKNQNEEGFVVGSRNVVTEKDHIAERTGIRKLMMILNNFLVKNVIGIDYIKDTQCGFKLYTRRAANRIFTHMHLNRWAFDVEMFYIGKHLNIPVFERAVNWREIEGSKLNVVAASISFIRDYLSIIFFYTTKIWKITI